MSLTMAAIAIGGIAVGSSLGGASQPDTSGMNQAAVQNAQLGQDQLNWYKQIYADQAPTRDAATQRAMAVSDAQLGAMNFATDQAKKDAAYREQTFEPLERGIVSDAENYDTLDRRDKAAGEAIGDVTQLGAAQRASTERNLQRMGVNPSDGAYADMERSADTGLTLGSVQAANNARDKVRATGQAMKMDAANLGRGLPSAQATETSLALNAGNSSVGNAQVPLNVGMQGAQFVGQGYNAAMYGNQSAANIYGNIAGIQNAAGHENDAMYGGLGQAFGSYAGSSAGSTQLAAMFAGSDKNEKTKREPMKGEIALSLLKSMPVEKWKYKSGSKYDDGGKSHVGPMAQAVQAKLGDAAAPGGKVIDLVSMNGLNMAATKELEKRVVALEHVRTKPRRTRA